jgi:hypothetical protein
VPLGTEQLRLASQCRVARLVGKMQRDRAWAAQLAGAAARVGAADVASRPSAGPSDHGRPPAPALRVDVPRKSGKLSLADARDPSVDAAVGGARPTRGQPNAQKPRGSTGNDIPHDAADAATTAASDAAAATAQASEPERRDLQREQWTKAGTEIEVDEETMRRVMRLTPKVPFQT